MDGGVEDLSAALVMVLLVVFSMPNGIGKAMGRRTICKWLLGTECP